MAVNIFKDTTYYPVHSTEWTKATDTPSDFKAPHKGKTLVLEVDSGTWYQYLGDANDITLNGWYAL